MKKFLFATLIALIGLAQQAIARDVINNASCSVRVTAVLYNTSTCTVSVTCMSVTVAGGSTGTLPECVPTGTTELLGYEVCWADAACAIVPCVSIGNSAGQYPCTQYPAGPVFLPACSGCSSAASGVKVHWIYPPLGGADLVIG